MCFSATASFTGAAAIGTVGAATIARNSSPRLRMFAAVPFLFAAQQASEGVVWLTMSGAEHARLHQLAINLFLLCALVLWPSWIPVSLYLAERNEERRKLLRWVSYLGATISLGALFMLLRQPPTVVIAGHSLSYVFAATTIPWFPAVTTLAYIASTFLPLFVSTSSMSRVVGIALTISIAVAYAVQSEALTSVWCFFAAFVSTLIFVAVGREQHALNAAPVRDRAFVIVRR